MFQYELLRINKLKTSEKTCLLWTQILFVVLSTKSDICRTLNFTIHNANSSKIKVNRQQNLRKCWYTHVIKD